LQNAAASFHSPLNLNIYYTERHSNFKLCFFLASLLQKIIRSGMPPLVRGAGYLWPSTFRSSAKESGCSAAWAELFSFFCPDSFSFLIFLDFSLFGSYNY
jgi:hypothetical protein